MDSFSQNIPSQEGEDVPLHFNLSTWSPQGNPSGQTDPAATAGEGHPHVVIPLGHVGGLVNLPGKQPASHRHFGFGSFSNQPIENQLVGHHMSNNPTIGHHYAGQYSHNNLRLQSQVANPSGQGNAVSDSAYPPRRIPQQNNRIPQQISRLPAADPNFVCSPNYQGNHRAPDNYSVDIPENENCNVFIRNLPPNCTTHMLLQKIRGCGSKVFASYINAPDRNNPFHCAAKLTFFQRCGVDWLFAEIRAGRFTLAENGHVYRPNACNNKIRVAGLPLEDERSRVVIVAGPPSVVNVQTLSDLFHRNFYFDIDCVYDHHASEDWKVMQIHFASARCQSENATQVLKAQTARPAESFAP